MVKVCHQITESGVSSESITVEYAQINFGVESFSDDDFMSEYEVFSLDSNLEASLLQSLCLYPSIL